MAALADVQSDRVSWDALPPAVRAGVGSVLGSAVVSTRGLAGGFSPGAAAEVRLADGRRAFVKAVGTPLNPNTPDLYRREVAVHEWLPRVPWTPALLGTYDDGEWVALAFEYVDAPTVPVPWSEASVDAVLALVRSMHDDLGPAPQGARELADAIGGGAGWRAWASASAPESAPAWAVAHLDRLAALEESWPSAGAGTALLHLDLRHDNVLLRGDEVRIVDWPWATRGVAWVDAVMLAVSVEAYGGPAAASVFARYGAAVERDALAVVLAALSGYLVPHALLPAPPRLPYLRPMQARHGEVTATWLDTLGLW